MGGRFVAKIAIKLLSSVISTKSFLFYKIKRSFSSLFRYYDTNYTIMIATKIYSAADFISDAADVPYSTCFQETGKALFYKPQKQRDII